MQTARKPGAGRVPENKVVSGDDKLARHPDIGWDLGREISGNRYTVRRG